MDLVFGIVNSNPRIVNNTCYYPNSPWGTFDYDVHGERQMGVHFAQLKIQLKDNWKQSLENVFMFFMFKKLFASCILFPHCC